MKVYVKDIDAMHDITVVRVRGTHQKGCLTVHGALSDTPSSSLELDVDMDLNPGDVELDERGVWEASAVPENELLLRGVLRRFEDGGGLLENPDGLVLVDFCAGFPDTLLDVAVQIRLHDVRGFPENG